MEDKQLIESGRYTCVGHRDGQRLFALRGTGIRPLILLYESAPGLLRGTDIHDKVIGKAAAMMAVLSGAGSVWGQIMSRSAADYLTSAGVPHSCGAQVARIINRTGDDICPLEAAVFSLDDPTEGYIALKERIALLMSGHPA